MLQRDALGRSVDDFFTSNKKIQTLKGLPVIVCHQAGFRKGSVFSPEKVLILVTEGTLQLSFGNSRHLVSAGQMALIRENASIDIQVLGESCHFFSIVLEYELIREFARLSRLSFRNVSEPSEIVLGNVSQLLRKYVESLKTYLDEAVTITDSLIRIKILELLFSLTGDSRQILDTLLDLRRNFRPDITQVVENNLMNTVSVNQLALMAGRSLSSFRRDFLSIYNMPPSQWIREKRLKKATEFLQTTNMTITDICYTLGFENLAHFSRLFKAQFGYSPSVYRSQLV